MMRDDYERKLARLHRAMISFDKDDPKRTQHFAKVHSYSRLIGQLEGMDEDSLFVLETAAYVHDIGIHVAEEKYGYQNGKLQEELGPGAAEKLLFDLGFPSEVVERACWLIGHHHTYGNIDSLDYQILVEADFLVNTFEDDDANMNRANESVKKVARQVRDSIFSTPTGISIINDMFGL